MFELLFFGDFVLNFTLLLSLTLILLVAKYHPTQTRQTIAAIITQIYQIGKSHYK